MLLAGMVLLFLQPGLRGAPGPCEVHILGQARAGDKIRTWGNEILECAILSVNPAHLTVLFAYGGT